MLFCLMWYNIPPTPPNPILVITAPNPILVTAAPNPILVITAPNPILVITAPMLGPWLLAHHRGEGYANTLVENLGSFGKLRRFPFWALGSFKGS